MQASEQACSILLKILRIILKQNGVAKYFSLVEKTSKNKWHFIVHHGMLFVCRPLQLMRAVLNFKEERASFSIV